jgi:hypothetical protein
MQLHQCKGEVCLVSKAEKETEDLKKFNPSF